jgi:hypothetical protein
MNFDLTSYFIGNLVGSTVTAMVIFGVFIIKMRRNK